MAIIIRVEMCGSLAWKRKRGRCIEVAFSGLDSPQNITHNIHNSCPRCALLTLSLPDSITVEFR